MGLFVNSETKGDGNSPMFRLETLRDSPQISESDRALKTLSNVSKHDVHMSPHTAASSHRVRRKLRRAARRREQKRKQNLQKSESGESGSNFWLALVYGIINAVIVLPVLISFGKIIYQDDFYRPYMPTLIRLTTMSGIVHQLVFSTVSSLPFAIGQVQDAGLIFLSKIASTAVSYCQEYGASDKEILATSTVGLALCTATLGVGLIIVGKFKLASHVQKLPTSVIGGYLAYIGFFCGKGGIGIMSESNVDHWSDWIHIFTNRKSCILIFPGICGGILIFCLVRKVRHMLTLPTCIISIIVLFYTILEYSGTSIDEAKEYGWISEAQTPPVWYHMWDYLRLRYVVWDALLQPSQILTWAAMTFVVALSSSLDVAAIELELGKKLDYNHEIKTVGLSNIISGITGGYTGSYIFSQSIFSLRAGIRTRVTGYSVAIIEFSTVILPVAVTSYVPNFFFGALLIMICVDLMVEWLWEVRRKVKTGEYFVAISTFLIIQFTGVEYGIVIGVLLYYGLNFVGVDVGLPKACLGSPTSSSCSSLSSMVSLNILEHVDEENGNEEPSNGGINKYGSVGTNGINI